MKLSALIFFAVLSVTAQTNLISTSSTNQPLTPSQRAEATRAECLQGRRLICGKILKVFPGGLVVDSGYTDLLRPPINSSWLIPGNVTATRAANMVESNEPEAICVGLVYVTDYPKVPQGAGKLRQYDYVSLLGYPAGHHTYTSAGTVEKTVRHFCADLQAAVKTKLKAAETNATPTTPK
ncbi:MAG: hypothetical protein H7Y43_16390 [Akkermansiaceae bacterium]|nr:hypothetical protein [Verrucomicrobiales bacterium]